MEGLMTGGSSGTPMARAVRWNRSRCALPALACLLALGGCGSSDDPLPPDDAPTLTTDSNPLGLPPLDIGSEGPTEDGEEAEPVDPNFNPLSGQTPPIGPASLPEALRTDVRAQDDYDVWRCEAGGGSFPVGYAFDTEESGVFYVYAPQVIDERAPFAWSVTASDAVRLEYPNLQEDITDIRFAGPDAWRGASSTDGELACARATLSPDTDASGAPAGELRERLANGFEDNELQDLWACNSPDLEVFASFAFTPAFELYGRREGEADLVVARVEYLATGADSFELRGPDLEVPHRFESIAFVGDDLLGMVSSVDGELSCGRYATQ